MEGMARCEISLEGLIEAFPKFPADEISEVYKEINKIKPDDGEKITISRNCS